MRRVKDEGWIHIEWSAEEQAFIGTSDSYPKLACFSKTAEDAFAGNTDMVRHVARENA